MTTKQLPVTGGAQHWPMFDRNHVRLHVGDKIRYQKCVGRYGQVETGECVIKDEHEPYCTIAGVHFEFVNGELIGYHKHHDFEHGHEIWVEVSHEKD